MEENETMLNGVVEGVIYRNPENGYSVLDVSCDGKLITAVGLLSVVEPGESLSLRGQWVLHPTYGSQFKVESFERNTPKSAADMLRYLSGGTIKGVGPATAQRVVDRFGDRTFEVIENEPDRLAEIRGISREKADAICDAFRKQFAVRETMIYLEKYGMTPTECLNTYKAFGSASVERVTENPYCLCGAKVGIGFVRADEIAQRMEHAVNADRKTDPRSHRIRRSLQNIRKGAGSG